MTQLEMLRKAFKEIGIEFFERTDDGSVYLFLGEDRGESFEVLKYEHCFEFDPDGSLASY